MFSNNFSSDDSNQSSGQNPTGTNPTQNTTPSFSFGGPPRNGATTGSATPFFGGPSPQVPTATTSSGSATGFGSFGSTSPSPGFSFGGATPSAFASTPSAISTTPSTFGSTSPTPAFSFGSTPSAIGSTPPTATTSSGSATGFGSFGSTTPSSAFGNTTSSSVFPPSSAPSFGNPTFGHATPSPFGGNSTPLFGPFANQPPSLFGIPPPPNSGPFGDPSIRTPYGFKNDETHFPGYLQVDNLEKSFEEKCWDHFTKTYAKTESDVGSKPVWVFEDLGGDLWKMFGQQDFSDVDFQVEGRVVKGHRNVLSARSPMFHTMFDDRQRDFPDQKCIVQIDDISHDTFLTLLEFCYSGKFVQEEMDQIVSLLQLSERFVLPALKNLCQSKLTRAIDSKTVFLLLPLAQKQDAFQLEEACISFILQNFAEISNSPQYSEMSQKSLSTILQRAMLGTKPVFFLQ